MRLVCVFVLATVLSACSSSPSLLTGPTGAAGSTQSIADLPPLVTDPGISCTSAAPNPFTVKVDASGTPGLHKFTFEWRPTAANITSYQLETRERSVNTMLPPTLATMDGRAVHVRYLPDGIYHFRVRATCAPGAWSVEVVKNAGVSALPDIRPEPEPEPEPEDEDVS